MKVVERVVERELDVARAVALWNIWDFEHVTWIHGSNYSSEQVLYEDERSAVMRVVCGVPFLPFLKIRTIQALIRRDDETTDIFNMAPFGIVANASLTCREISRDRCRFVLRYRFVLEGWRGILAPFVAFYFDHWKRRIWSEDSPLQLRRQKVLRMGFQDGGGLPQDISSRHNEEPIPFKLPLPRRKDSPVNKILNALRKS